MAVFWPPSINEMSLGELRLPQTYGNSMAWVAPTSSSFSIGVDQSNRYRYTGAALLWPSASHTDSIRKPRSLAILRPLALTRIPEYADSICSWVGNYRSGCSAAIWSNAAVIACGVIGIKGDFSHRNSILSKKWSLRTCRGRFIVLVAAKSDLTNPDNTKRDPRSWRISITLERDGGQLKISKLEFV